MPRKGKKFYMYSTSIEPEKSSYEMQNVLRAIGATHIVTEYEDGEAVGMFFIVDMQGKKASFSIPIRWENVQQGMIDSGVQKAFCRSVDQCKRTAWRIALRWVQAQGALIQAGGAEVIEAFMPYARVDTVGTTFYQKIKDQGFKMLPAPQEPHA